MGFKFEHTNQKDFNRLAEIYVVNRLNKSNLDNIEEKIAAILQYYEEAMQELNKQYNRIMSDNDGEYPLRKIKQPY